MLWTSIETDRAESKISLNIQAIPAEKRCKVTWSFRDLPKTALSNCVCVFSVAWK